MDNRIGIREAASILQNTEQWVYKLVQRGRLTEHRVGEGSLGRNKEGIIMLDRDEVVKYAEEQKKEAARASS